MRDFLISLKEFAGDNAELYAEEKEVAERDAKAAERERLSKVGGLIKPAELDDEDELWLDKELRIDHAQQENIPSDQERRINYNANKLDGWDVYDLWPTFPKLLAEHTAVRSG